MTGKQQPQPGAHDATPRQGGGPARRAYSRPTLVEYGPVSKLTQGTFTKQNDSVGAGFRMGCL